MKKKKTNGLGKNDNFDIKTNNINDFVEGLYGNPFFGAELSKADTMAWNNRWSSVTLNRSLISEMYQEHGYIQVIVDQPVDDAFRGGIDILCEEFDEVDLKKLTSYIDEHNILITYGKGLKWNRLFGGAGIIINAGQEMDKPFNIEAINENTPLEFYACDRWELSYAPSGMFLDQFSKDKYETPFNYYGHVLHASNVIKLMGKEAPSLIRGQFGGWGVSEIERLVRPYNQFLKHQDVVFELLDEAKVDVFKIQGFNSALTTRNGAQITAKRISAAAKIKNYQNALVVDKEDDYEQKQMQYGGLSDVLQQIRIDLACEARMPMTKLFGISAAGFSSGEDDIENYNAMIETEIRSKVKAGLLLMIKICCKKLFGFVPDSIDFAFKPLRIMSARDESQLKTETLARIMEAQRGGLMSNVAAVDQINAAKIFAMNVSPEESVSLDELSDMKADQETVEADTEGGYDNE